MGLLGKILEMFVNGVERTTESIMREASVKSQEACRKADELEEKLDRNRSHMSQEQIEEYEDAISKVRERAEWIESHK